MYHNYFGLKEQAFSIAVNPKYLYMSQQHKEALAHLLYGVQGGGFVMLTGEVGTGKTTIVKSLLDQLPNETEIAIILNPMANVTELLQTICDELEASYYNDDLTVKSLTDALHQKLLDNFTEGKNTVLLIDEAQLLSADVLEQIRLLTNLETDTQKLLQIILVGQPELNDLLAQPRLRQLSQRIVARYHLSPLTLKETEYYIEHRLAVAGLTDGRNPFPRKIIGQIHQFTNGIPRLINVICERTLIGAYGHNQHDVDENILRLAKYEVTGKKYDNNSNDGFKVPLKLPDIDSKILAIGGGLIACVLLIVIASQFISDNEPTESSSSSITQELTPIQPPITAPAPTIEKQPEIEPKTSIATPTTTETPAIVNAKFDISDKNLSERIYFEYLGFELSPNTPPCWQLGDKNYECTVANVETWDDIRQLNRPAVLTLITEERFFSYAVLIGINEDVALIINGEGRQQSISLAELGPLWTGAIYYVWKKPEGFNKPISLGQASPVVKEMAELFAIIDSQSKPLARTLYNPALKRRVQLFQEANSLTDDGILGQKTIMKIYEQAGAAFVLQNDF